MGNKKIKKIIKGGQYSLSKKKTIDLFQQTDEETLKIKYEKDLADIKALKKKDENNFDKAIAGRAKFDYSGIARLVGGDLAATGYYQSFNVYGVTPLQISLALKNPMTLNNWRILVILSNYLYLTSGNYKRLIDYFADMSCHAWDVDVSVKNENKIDLTKFQNKYTDLLFELEKMNLPHELNKILHVVMREGVYYGYVYSDSKDFFFNKLDMAHCRAIEIQDGVFNVEVNLAALNENNAETFPPEVQEAWQEWLESQLQNGRTNSRQPYISFSQTAIPQNNTAVMPGILGASQSYTSQAGVWFRLNPKNAICIKVDETQNAIIPYFIYLFKDILNIEDYKELQKKHAEMENYRIITLKIPIKKDANEADDFAVSDDTVADNVETATIVTDSNIAILPTALEPEAIKFDQKSNDKDNVKSAIDTLNSDAGVNGNIFNGGNSTSLMISVENDSSLIYKINRQIQRWIERHIKLSGYNNANYRFTFEFLDMTVYNRDKVVDRMFKACQSGLPVKRKLGSSLGVSATRLIGGDFLENVVLKLGENWRPLSTSFTQSKGGVESEGGRPAVDDTELTEAGVQTREGGYNDADMRDYQMQFEEV